MKPGKIIGPLCAALFFAGASAEPAAWFKWHNGAADYVLCAQVSPGPGWIATDGPFQDSLCKKRGAPSGHF